MGFKTGWRKDPKKPHGAKPDRSAGSVLPSGPILASADNTRLIRSTLDQENHESCVGNMVAQLLRADMIRQFGEAPLPSRHWIWHLARAEDGAQKLDVGTYIRAAFSAVSKLGYPPEDVWPYDDEMLPTASGMLEPRYACLPSSEAFRQAHDQCAQIGVAYYRIDAVGDARIEMVQRAIAAGYCVGFGTLITSDFMEYTSGILRVTPKSSLGGHALLMVGYDKDSVKVCNSYSSNWGDHGFCRMGWDYVAWNQTDDLWIALHAPRLTS